MSLLDDLKQQADSLRQKQQITQEEINQNLLAAHIKLNEALHYWIDLFNSLNVIKPVIPRFYYLESGATRLDNLMQCDYNVNGRRLTADHKDYIEAVVLRFRCLSDQKLTIEKQSDPMVQRLRDHLWSNNIKFDLKELRNERGYVERGIFTVIAEVPVSITITADLEMARIKIATKNLERLGDYVYVYDFDEFNRNLLEELAKVIIVKPNVFRTMGRHQAAVLTTTPRAPRIADSGTETPIKAG
ncbi:MAG TPA: hypothetical protein VMT94_09470 [Burkholderiales bacterium]|nr:hypothetical protein [Burkholderiales bacterium]